MVTVIKLILTTSILVLGWTIATQPKMLLYSVRMWAESKNAIIYEPLFLCHWCMGSIWSVFGYSFALATGMVCWGGWHMIAMYPLVVCGSSIVCGLTWAFYQMVSAATDYLKYLSEK